ncbi:D-alanyl-D-alanine carboxypeptidase family protein [Candidatus Allofournierella merdipullorum]|uniref:D-alanyl-D-alanine carboxypeptidase family protein n=1 Tax=Candidatus Allofournierella merdipullorum TaxID=2838595 RepID=UPI00374E2C92
MKRFLALALTLAVSLTMAFSAAAGWEPPEGAVNAEAVVLYNVDTDTVVYEKNAHEERAAASLTKMMTGLLLAESGEDLSQTFTIPEGLAAEFDRIQAENGSDADLKIGETVTLESLLYACLLPSGNDAASAIAYYLGNGDMQAFFDKMNARAAELGCENTNFTCAHGLYGLEYGNHSTAWDMFLIARAFRENDLLMEVVTQTGYWMPLTNLHTEAKSADAPAGAAYYVGTTNVMQLPDQALYRPYIRGIKTGFTDEAGRCFASSAESGGMTWLMVVMGAPIQLAEDGFNYAFHTTADLYDWALVNFWPVELPNTETPVASVPVKWCAESETVSLYAASTLTTLQCADSAVEVVAEELPQTLEAPVEAGQAAGRAAVYVDGERVGTVELVTGSACRRSGWLYYKEQLAPFAPVLIGAAVLLALAVLLAAVRGAKRRKKAARPR